MSAREAPGARLGSTGRSGLPGVLAAHCLQVLSRATRKGGPEAGFRAAGAAEPARASGILAAQKLWHVPKAHLLELFEEGFWRCAVVQPATLVAL